MFANGADKLPVDATLRYCVLIYGIVNVSNINVAFAAFAVRVPVTLSVSVTFTLGVVSAFDTYTFPVTCKFAVAGEDDPIPTPGM